MADDLDKYLENLGIDVGDTQEPTLPDFEPKFAQEEPVGSAPVAATLTPAAVVAAPLEGNLKEQCETFLVNLLLHFDPTYAVEVQSATHDEIKAEIYGGDSGKIIGRNGRTLAALEYVTNAVLNRDSDSNKLHVDLDIGGYKRRRDERLIGIARKAAARVRKTGFAVELEPMMAAERRVIHMELAENPYVKSESTGEGRNRRVVVKPT